MALYRERQRALERESEKQRERDRSSHREREERKESGEKPRSDSTAGKTEESLCRLHYLFYIKILTGINLGLVV